MVGRARAARLERRGCRCGTQGDPVSTATRVEDGVDVAFVEGDVAALQHAGVGTGFSFFLDVECFNHLNDSQRAAVGREVNAVASPDATILLLAWASRSPRPVPTGRERRRPHEGVLRVEDRRRARLRRRTPTTVEEHRRPLAPAGARLTIGRSPSEPPTTTEAMGHPPPLEHDRSDDQPGFRHPASLRDRPLCLATSVRDVLQEDTASATTNQRPKDRPAGRSVRVRALSARACCPEAVDHGCPPMYADPTYDPRMQPH